jgi:hypothetical protein
MTINNQFDIEDNVYLITDTDQSIRIITGIQISKGELLYRLANGTLDSWHYEFEISKDKNYKL